MPATILTLDIRDDQIPQWWSRSFSSLGFRLSMVKSITSLVGWYAGVAKKVSRFWDYEA